jgi:hypothetical protein
MWTPALPAVLSSVSMLHAPWAPLRPRIGATACATVAGAVLALALFMAAPPPARAEPASIPRFTLFGWVSPPVPESTPARYAELAAAGMNVAVLAQDDPQDRDVNLARLDLAAAVGMRCIIADRRFDRVGQLGLDTPQGLALVDSIVADYRGHPGFLGYTFGDEPKSDSWPGLARIFRVLEARDPDHPAWNNLSGFTGYDSLVWVADNTGYLDHVHPAILCNDHYDFRIGYDQHRFVSNAAALRKWSLERNIPFWSIVLLVPHGGYRAVTEGELAWQVSMLLAYGARGVGYFTYWTPAPDSAVHWGPAIITHDGQRTAWYDVVSRMNVRVRAAGELLAGLTWVSTQHAGSRPFGGEPFRGDDWLNGVDGRAAIGRFTDAAGVPYLVVVNSDSLAPREISLTLTGASGISRLVVEPTGWQLQPAEREGDRVQVTLRFSAGEFGLFRLEGTFAAGARLGPTLAVTPNPASDDVRFDLARLAGEARVEVLDSTGRRVWSYALPAGRASVTWRGECLDGGRAPAGIYFARVSDTRGSVARRWAWLGAR